MALEIAVELTELFIAVSMHDDMVATHSTHPCVLGICSIDQPITPDT